MNRFLRVGCALALSASISSVGAKTIVYVSVSGENRIAIYELQPEDGRLQYRADLALDADPGALAVDPSRRILFASLRTAGQLSSFRINPETGLLQQLSAIHAAEDPAYLTVDASGNHLLSAYYVAGKVASHAISVDGRLQAVGHWYGTADKAHAIVLDRTNRWALVPHTGPNVIFQFQYQAATGELTPNRTPKLQLPEQTGPRHLAFHPTRDWVYCDNEQGSSVTMFRFDPAQGTLEPRQTLSTLPPGYLQPNSCAHMELSPSGRFLYAANRGHDSIACFAVDENTGQLTALGQTPTEATPRSFQIEPDGQFLIAAGQGSGKLALFSISDAGALTRQQTYDVGEAPWWVQVVRLPGV